MAHAMPAPRPRRPKTTAAPVQATAPLPFHGASGPVPAPLRAFHPAVVAWFTQSFSAPTAAQREAWPAIASGRHALIAAPTGSGKTLAAFLAAIDALVREGETAGGILPDATAVVYVSPLKALSNDIARNLELPLTGIRAQLQALGYPDVAIRTAVRTGDTPSGERTAMRKKPPHILVTTPESLYVLLGSASGRAALASARTVIVDEIHAVAGNKRGSHLALSLERLQALCGRRLLRIGLSATQRPIEGIARFLVGAATPPPPACNGRSGGASNPDEDTRDRTPPQPSPARREGSEGDVVIVDIGHARERDLAIELPPVPLTAVMANEVWEHVYDRLAALVTEHRTTLVFVNTRRMAERIARHLSERLGHAAVAAHHGSMARELRLDAEQRLKHGQLRVLVATASLELGIDIGEVDLVCQLGSPRAIAAFLQRVGRSGHAVGALPKGRLFPSSRDDLVECAALLDCVRRGELDLLRMPPAPLDVLAQQIVADVGSREWDEDALYATFRQAWPYARLPSATFAEVVRMLAEGYSTRRGTRAGLIHRDAVHRKLRGNPAGRLIALTSGGTIPDTADYTVMLEPGAQNVGSVNEDFAVESITGDIFQLGNASYRILRVERGTLRVEDAKGLPPTIPFWLGEAPGRSDALSIGVSRLREEIATRLTASLLPPGEVGARSAPGEGTKPAPETAKDALHWLTHELGINDAAASQIVDYLRSALDAFGMLPTRRVLAMERFFDESGGAQLVIHSPYGSRINKAWGLALRKRFCRSFNFELQAAATEDAIILSLSTSHSFPLADVGRFLHSHTAGDVLVQALLDAPMFPLRWRWNATTALALPRFSGSRRVAPQIQRMRSEDLLATVFPDQVACLENIVGERKIPDHPLVAQTLWDCLHEAMDLDGFLDLLRGLESGAVTIVARDLVAPSPLAAEILNAKPYAFLDDAPLEERRTQAVQNRRFADPQHPDDLGRLDAGAITAVREEAWPQARNADEVHEALLGLGVVTVAEAAANPGWANWLAALADDDRATRVQPPSPAAVRHPLPEGEGKAGFWAAAERLPQVLALYPDAAIEPTIEAPAEFATLAWSAEDALVDLVRARLTGLGPTTIDALAATFALAPKTVEVALVRLEVEGYVMRGNFEEASTMPIASAPPTQWCERHLLARIHRYTLGRLRREIEPVAPRDYLRFACHWQHLAPATRMKGSDALAAVLAQLEGFEAPAAAWESQILPARIADYDPAWLDALCQAGRIAWTRLRAPATGEASTTARAGPVRATPIVLVPRREQATWSALATPAPPDEGITSSRARKVADHLREHGASFFDELQVATRLLETELEDALGELVAIGRVHADSFAGLRALLIPAARRARPGAPRRTRRGLFGIADAGRWSLIRRAAASEDGNDDARHEHLVRTLLRRHGVVCWQVLQREAAWLPPWRSLLRCFHRLEARGEIRGGRFIAGLSGEQFALPDAIGLLRQVRQHPHDEAIVCISGADPLNLAGLLVPGTRVPAVTSSRIAWRDGMPIATLVAGEVTLLESIAPTDATGVRGMLLRNLPSQAAPAAATSSAPVPAAAAGK